MKEQKRWNLCISENDGIVEIVATGEVTPDTADDLQNEVFAIIKSRSTRALLVDVRRIRGRFGLTDAYHRVRSLHTEVPIVRIAVVDLEKHRELQQFYEVAYDVGRSRRWFTDIGSARAWLRDVHTPADG